MPAAVPMRRTFLVFILACAMALSLVATLSSPVRAASVTVNTTNDEHDALANSTCSLREAIVAANTDAAFGGCTVQGTGAVDSITVPAGTYPLDLFAEDGSDDSGPEAGDLDILDDLTLTGAGASTTIIDGQASQAVAAGEEPERVIDMEGPLGVTIEVTISGVTIQNGEWRNNGGGVRADNPTELTMTDSVIQNNVAGEDGGGLYIHSSSTATLRRVTVTGNDAFLGGGIYNNSDGTDGEDGGLPGLLIEDSTISANDAIDTKGGGHGGGIYNDDDASIVGTTLSGNTADRAGGGIFNDSWDESREVSTGATLTVTDSIVASNDASYGGGIFNNGGGVSILRSTISGNDASSEGGGIVNETVLLFGLRQEDTLLVGVFDEPVGVVEILNSTVSGNTATGNGGGIHNDGGLAVYFSTVASNTADAANSTDWSGGGIWIDQGSDAQLYASIVGNNAPNDCLNNGSVTTLGSNIDSDDTCGLDADADQPDTDPKLGPLASNPPGGTQTHALLFDSPAVDAVGPGEFITTRAGFLLVGGLPTCGVAPTDQRGVTRPQDGDSNGVAVCDIGAYELLPPTASISDVTVIEGDSGTVSAVFTVTLSRPSTGTVTYGFATANDTATVVADYQAATGTVTFAPNDVSETITVQVVGDTIDEPNETFFVNLTVGVGGTLLDAQGVGTILDDEGPIVTPTPAAAQLPNTGTGSDGLGGWGSGVAIGLLVLSATVLIRNRRRQTVRARLGVVHITRGENP